MADFNPYREWLQIQSAAATPDYYTLLDLRPLESDSAQINAGFQRQAARIAPHLSGIQGSLAQRLMSELAEARVTLLTPTARRAYDQALSTAHQQAARSPQPKKQRWAEPTGRGQDELLPPAAVPGSSAAPSGGAAAAPQPAAEPAAMPQPIPQALPMPHVAAQPTWQAPSQALPVAQGYAMPYGAYPAQSPTQPGYFEGYGYGAPQAYAAAPLATEAPATLEPPVPSLAGATEGGYRPVRRRSSSGPALAGLLVATAGVVGVVYWAVKKDPNVIAANQPADANGDANKRAAAQMPDSRPAAVQPPAPSPPADRKAPGGSDRRAASGETTVPNSRDGTPANKTNSNLTPPEPATMPGNQRDNVKPVEPRPADAAPTANPTPVPETPKPPPDEKMPDEKMPVETPADPEEAAAVARSLEAARKALVNRDLSSAQDHLDEATLEASAPDTRADVARVQALATYVDGFWNAVRQQLIALEAGEELDIEGEMASVVDANEKLLALRVRGQSKTYQVPKTIPAKIALYLARRWLAKGEPGTDLALAAFYLVEKNADLGEVQPLLDSAQAAGANVDPLADELAWRKKGLKANQAE